MGERAMTASYGAIQDARLALAAIYGRAATAEDLPRLIGAGMAAWETTLLGVVRDPSSPPALAGLAAQAWLAGREMIAPQVADMARAMIG